VVHKDMGNAKLLFPGCASVELKICNTFVVSVTPYYLGSSVPLHRQPNIGKGFIIIVIYSILLQ
jgi:hypothetical protein